MGCALRTGAAGLETGLDPCYIHNAMPKTLKISSAGADLNSGEISPKLVRDPKTGQLVAVRGFGALKDSDLKIRKGVNLTKPIAAQALTGRREKHSAG